MNGLNDFVTPAEEDNGPNLDGTTTFVYDDLNRLTEAVYPGNQAVSYRRVTYSYNDSGDRTSLAQWTGSPGSWTQYGSTTSYSYDAAGRMTAAGGLNYCYDAASRQTRRTTSACPTGGDTFSWDQESRLASAVISGTTTAYKYNEDGVRTRKTVGSTYTDYYQDTAGGLPRVVAEVPLAGTAVYYAYGNGLIGKRDSSGAARYYHADGTGHTRAITDATGAVVERYDYDAFGALRNTPAGVVNDRRYTGEQHDGETGYTFLRARYYDPTLGRFISKDPFDGVKQDPQSLNGYIYVQNNPINRTDPSGKCAIVLCIAVGAVVWEYGAVALAAAGTLWGAWQAGVGIGEYILESNPDGSRGGPAHQGKIEERIKELQEEGLEHIGGGSRKEEYIRIPEGGHKTARRPDITMVDPETGTKYRENVGRTNSHGDPIPREVEALEDIELAKPADSTGYSGYDR